MKGELCNLSDGGGCGQSCDNHMTMQRGEELTLSCRSTIVSRASESPHVNSLRVCPFSEASSTSVREGGEVIIRGNGVGRVRRDRRKEER